LLARAAAAALAFALVSLAASLAPAADLLAGAAAVELKPPAGVPLAGYGAWARRRLLPDVFGRTPHAFWFRSSVGTHDPLMARALVIEASGERVLWIAVDLIAVDEAMVSDLTSRLAAAGLRYSAVIVSASHTHSGPGAFVDSALLALVAVDRLDGAVRASLLAGMAEAATRAERGKARARLGVGTEMAPPITRSRVARALDPEIVLFKLARADGSPVALLWNFAIHGTVLGPRNLELSADVMGVASRAVEARIGGPALFINGAVGDVSPAGHGPQAADELGGRLAESVVAGWRRIAVDDAAGIGIARERLDVGSPSLSLRNCMGGWVPGFARMPLGTSLPSSVELIALGLGPGAWVTVPGELQTRLGVAVKDAGRRRFAAVGIAGLSNGYLGYLLTGEDYGRPSYVSCGSLYGEAAGERIAAAAGALLARLGGRTATTIAPTSPRTARAPARTSCARRCSDG
jgi:hypothetical protein